LASLANENLNTIGHVTLGFFQEVPIEDRLASGVYLKAFKIAKNRNREHHSIMQNN